MVLCTVIAFAVSVEAPNVPGSMPGQAIFHFSPSVFLTLSTWLILLEQENHGLDNCPEVPNYDEKSNVELRKKTLN